jgi:hypothetical protein
MIRKSIYKFPIANILILFTLFALTACGSSNSPSSRDRSEGTVYHDGENLSLSLSSPGFLAQAALCSNTLKAEAAIGGGSPYSLTVDPYTNGISGTIPDISAGTHNLAITYFVYTSGKVVLCTFSTQVTVIAGQATNVQISDTDLNRNHDSDYDGYTNLAEVRMCFNPLSAASFPPGESPHVVVGNGTTSRFLSSTNYNMSVVVGSTLAGTASSGNYRVITSFYGRDHE